MREEHAEDYKGEGGSNEFLITCKTNRDIVSPDGALPFKLLLHFTERLENFKVLAAEWDCQIGI